VTLGTGRNSLALSATVSTLRSVAPGNASSIEMKSGSIVAAAAMHGAIIAAQFLVMSQTPHGSEPDGKGSSSAISIH
jgi:hypothetical protein